MGEGSPAAGYYVAQYDGEIAAVDVKLGRVLEVLDRTHRLRACTLVVVASDHGESLGEHGYFFDHGENLFDPSLRIPLLIAGPGIGRGRRSAELASTLDIVPTLLDALKVLYRPHRGLSPLGAARGEPLAHARPGTERPQPAASWDWCFKPVATPVDSGARYTLYDRQHDPGETRDAGPANAAVLRQEGRVELFRERIDAQLVRTRRLLEGRSGDEALSAGACENLKALGYVVPV